MPRFKNEDGSYYSSPEIHRILIPIKGKPKIKVEYEPKLEYSVGKTVNYLKKNFIVSLVEDKNYETLFLYTDLDKKDILNGNEIVIDKKIFFCVSYNEKINIPNFDSICLEYEKTIVYWLNWTNKNPQYKNYTDQINRSAITLKLLTFETGAVLAAATTSIPETIGEVRNWDYRFCWIRDASMVIKIITKLGHVKIVKNFIDFIVNLIPKKMKSYKLCTELMEKDSYRKKLDHLSGFMSSKPVRIGNAAYFQKQNDIYGILMDAIHFQILKFQENKYQQEQLWSIVKSIVWSVNKNWKKADKGIWDLEIKKCTSFSKLLCWVAVDRAIKISKLIQRGEKAKKWESLRKEIHDDIITNAWSKKKQAFTQSYGSEELDSSVLLMESYGFIKADNIKFVKTVKSIENELMFEGLLFRYKNKDDFGEPKSSFTVVLFGSLIVYIK